MQLSLIKFDTEKRRGGENMKLDIEKIKSLMIKPHLLQTEPVDFENMTLYRALEGKSLYEWCAFIKAKIC